MSPESERLRKAALEWNEAVDDVRIDPTFHEGEDEKAADRGTSLYRAHSPGRVYAESVSDVRDILDIATKHGIRLHPVSRGKNYGYGGSHPTDDGTVLLDLSRLDRILEFDEELGYVTLEPGVTYEQLHEYLKRRNSKFQPPQMGGPNDASLIGNRLERGIVGVFWQGAAEPVVNLEVLCPNGHRFATGTGSLPGAQSSEVRPFPPGPDPTELFAQSNLGVVTKATFGLPRSAEHLRALSFSIRDEEAFRAAIPELRDMIQTGLISPSFGLYNDFRTLAERSGWQGPTDSDGSISARQVDDLPDWRSVLFFRSTDRLAGWARARRAKKTLAPYTDQLFHIGPTLRHITDALGGAARSLGLFESSVDFVTRLAEITGGERLIDGVPMAYWRKPFTPDPQQNPDPVNDGCGVFWFAPCVPFRADQIVEVNEAIRQIVLSHRLEPFIALHPWSERSILLVLGLIFDRDDANQRSRARKCIDDLSDWVSETGYYPYRLGLDEMDLLSESVDDFPAFLADLKATLDPANILSPGRYDYRSDGPEDD